MSDVSREFLERVERRATEECLRIAIDAAGELVQDELAYGDEPFESDADFVAFYLDLERTGALQFLPMIAPRLAKRMETKFRNAERKMLDVEPVPAQMSEVA